MSVGSMQFSQRHVVHQDVVHRRLQTAVLDAQAGRRVALRVEVDDQDRCPSSARAGADVDRRRRLADTALLIGDGDHAGERIPPGPNSACGSASTAARRARRRRLDGFTDRRRQIELGRRRRRWRWKRRVGHDGESRPRVVDGEGWVRSWSRSTWNKNAGESPNVDHAPRGTRCRTATWVALTRCWKSPLRSALLQRSAPPGGSLTTSRPPIARIGNVASITTDGGPNPRATTAATGSPSIPGS